MIGIFGHLILQEYRFQFRSRVYYALLVLNCLLSLVVYWFASQALEPSTSFGPLWMARSYFEFLLLGELVLMLPLAIVPAGSSAVRFSSHEGLLEDFFLLPDGPLRPLLGIAFSLLLPVILHIAVTLGLAMLLFGFSMGPNKLILIALSILSSLPLFVALAVIAAGVLLRFGRGEGVINQACYVASVFAGMYFPLAALPAYLHQGLSFISPFAVLLEHCRRINAGQTPEWIGIAVLLAVGLLALPLALWFFERSCGKVRTGHLPQLSHS